MLITMANILCQFYFLLVIHVCILVNKLQFRTLTTNYQNISTLTISFIVVNWNLSIKTIHFVFFYHIQTVVKFKIYVIHVSVTS